MQRNRFRRDTSSIGIRPAIAPLVLKELSTEIPIPALARAMCASPFDAAIHDATGIALGRSAFRLFDEDVPIPSADTHFPHGGVLIEAIRRVIRPMRRTLQAWLVVSKTDSLPELIANAYAKSGYRCFKLKITGRDNAEDVRRTIEVHRAAQSVGVAKPTLVIDSNEANPDAASVLDYLEQLEALDCEAYRVWPISSSQRHGTSSTCHLTGGRSPAQAGFA